MPLVHSEAIAPTPALKILNPMKRILFLAIGVGVLSMLGYLLAPPTPEMRIRNVRPELQVFQRLKGMLEEDVRVSMVHVDGGVADAVLHYVKPNQVGITTEWLQVYLTLLKQVGAYSASRNATSVSFLIGARGFAGGGVREFIMSAESLSMEGAVCITNGWYYVRSKE